MFHRTEIRYADVFLISLFVISLFVSETCSSSTMLERAMRLKAPIIINGMRKKCSGIRCDPWSHLPVYIYSFAFGVEHQDVPGLEADGEPLPLRLLIRELLSLDDDLLVLPFKENIEKVG